MPNLLPFSIEASCRKRRRVVERKRLGLNGHLQARLSRTMPSGLIVLLVASASVPVWLWHTAALSACLLGFCGYDAGGLSSKPCHEP